MASSLGFVHHYEAGSGPLTLLLLHGTGGSERALVGLARDLAPGAGLLSPRGKVLEGDQPRFFRRLREGVFDEADIRLRARELSEFMAAAARSYSFDPARVAAFGYSNGANMAGALLLLHPEALAGAVLMRAMVPLVPDRLPDLAGTPVFIGAGRHDDMIPTDQPRALAELLRRAGADVTLLWQDTGHKMNAAELESARRWIAERWG
jgi:phospholipase/carboxylesterase